ELALLATMLGVARIGATVFSLPRGMPALLRKQMIDEARVSVLACDTKDASADATDAAPAPLRVDIAALAASRSPIDESVRAAAPAAPWLLISGSGSTGRSKLIPVTHPLFVARMRPALAEYDRGEQDRIASLIHLDHASAKGRCLDVLFTGGSLVLFDRASTDVAELCRGFGVTVLFASVLHVEALLRALPEDASHALGSLRILYVGSSTVSDALRQRIARRLTPNLYVRYGTNESGLISLATPEHIARTPGTVGVPVPGVEVQIVDAGGRPCAAGEIGRVRVRGAGVFKGYADDPEATRRCFEDGWFVPGDLAKFTADGELVYCGRADHMMIMDGINVYPAEIERVLCDHPAVRDAAAVPLRSEIHQDIPVCAVALRDGALAAEAELRAFAVARLGARAPRRVVVLDRIPRNELGKLVRSQLGRSLQAAFGDARAHAGARTLRQPTRRVRLTLSLPGEIDPGALDDWLLHALELPAPQDGADPAAIPPERDPAHAAVRQTLRRCLQVAGTLLQTAYVPAFDTGEVLELAPAPGRASTWLATVTVVDVEHIDSRCYEIALREAVALVNWMRLRPRTPQSTRALHARIDQSIPLLRRLALGGKSTLPLLRVAHQMDIPLRHLGGGAYQLGWGSRAIRADRSTTGLDSALGARLAQSKQWTAALAASAGLPAPRHEIIGSREEALAAATRLGWPVVVKPVGLDRGEGVTVGIAERTALDEAFDTAATLSKRRQVIVEREVPGVCHRLFVAAGSLLYAVKRLPKSVEGDGRHTVAELVALANRRDRARPPWLRTEPWPLDQAARQAMALAGFGEGSVPGPGVLVPLRRIESTEWGGVDEDVTGRVHPDNLDVALRAARLFGLSVAGIDIITTDIGKPWHETGAIVNEVNYAPLLGGGEISRRHIPEFLRRFLAGDGRIPIDAVVGDDPGLAHAFARQGERRAEGLRCFVTSHAQTFTDGGAPLHLPFGTLWRRAGALLLDERVDALVLSIGTDEALHAGLPVDRITRITRASDRLQDSRASDRPAPEGSLDRVLAMLDAASASRGDRA
ncbi:MAG TPA: AMP-binding protein, partial [Quisquiliibacterium sp.]|nr:AMP-binding protein [Quisquiliibacterium sp.]